MTGVAPLKAQCALNRAMRVGWPGVYDTVVTAMRPHAAWVLGRHQGADGRIAHLVEQGYAAWIDGRPFPGVKARCGFSAASRVVLSAEPEDVRFCDHCLLTGDHVVYRAWSAVVERPLYIGYSASISRRFDNHRRNADWWPLMVRADYEVYPDEPAARRAEWLAIQSEHPIHNRPPGRSKAAA